MNEERLIKLCLELKGAVKSNPFKRDEYNEITVMRHGDNKKWFALIFYLDDKLYINLKVKPYDSLALRDQYKSITPAWHMNKKNWIKVDVNNIDEILLKELIKISYDLTAKKTKS